jgi:tRNA (guanine37-N1)-methyltransferase
MIDATVRLLPGAMSDIESAQTDSFYGDRKISAPSYTRPPDYRGFTVPEILLSGDHAKIAQWKKAQERDEPRHEPKAPTAEGGNLLPSSAAPKFRE